MLRAIAAATTLFCLIAPVRAHESPDAIYTGMRNIYVSPVRAMKRVRHVRHHRKARRHHARAHRKRAHVKRRKGNVHSRSGAWASVNPRYASRFQCIVNKLEAVGYRIRFMGGYRHTRIASRYGRGQWSKHAVGNAIDINQTGRNRTVGRMPRGATAMAKACGLLHGAVWRHPDAGHFEVPGPNPTFSRVAHR